MITATPTAYLEGSEAPNPIITATPTAYDQQHPTPTPQPTRTLTLTLTPHTSLVYSVGSVVDAESDPVPHCPQHGFSIPSTAMPPSHAVCNSPCSVQFAMQYAIRHAVCHSPCSVQFAMQCAIRHASSHAVCHSSCSVPFGMPPAMQCAICRTFVGEFEVPYPYIWRREVGEGDHLQAGMQHSAQWVTGHSKTCGTVCRGGMSQGMWQSMQHGMQSPLAAHLRPPILPTPLVPPSLVPPCSAPASRCWVLGWVLGCPLYLWGLA